MYECLWDQCLEIFIEQQQATEEKKNACLILLPISKTHIQYIKYEEKNFMLNTFTYIQNIYLIQYINMKKKIACLIFYLYPIYIYPVY